MTFKVIRGQGQGLGDDLSPLLGLFLKEITPYFQFGALTLFVGSKKDIQYLSLGFGWEVRRNRMV